MSIQNKIKCLRCELRQLGLNSEEIEVYVISFKWYEAIKMDGRL